MDDNADGNRDAGEPGLNGVTINLVGVDSDGNAITTDLDGNALTTVTENNNVDPFDPGHFWFLNLKPGTYTVSEVVPAGSEPSTPISFVLDTLDSGESDTSTVFGNFVLGSLHAHKFFDGIMEDGIQQEGENNLLGVTFTLTGIDGMGNDVGPIDMVTDEDGLAWWMDLKPGTYTITEDQTSLGGLFPTIPSDGIHADIILTSGQTITKEFGNVGDCNGLTPGYWQAKLFDPANNQINDYDFDQSILLITDTIVDDGTLTQDDIDEALVILRLPDASDPIQKLEKFVLANQLTLNLTQLVAGDPGFPNTDSASLFGACMLLDNLDVGSLGDLLDLAIEYINAGQATTDFNDDGFINDQDVLDLKTVLDQFANLNF